MIEKLQNLHLSRNLGRTIILKVFSLKSLGDAENQETCFDLTECVSLSGRL